MNTELAAQEQCSHPELMHTMQFGSPQDYVYQCTRCKKKIIIPGTTLIEQGEMALKGIVGLAFGENWSKV